jgi:hypothetical protein
MRSLYHVTRLAVDHLRCFLQVALPTQSFCINGITSRSAMGKALAQLVRAGLVVVELLKWIPLTLSEALRESV